MLHTNDSLDDLDITDDTTSSLSGLGTSQDSDTVIVQGTEFTKEEIEQANKPQPNVILNKTADGNPGASQSYKDSERVNDRSNEASDSTDSNTGNMIAGAAKGTSQS